VAMAGVVDPGDGASGPSGEAVVPSASLRSCPLPPPAEQPAMATIRIAGEGNFAQRNGVQWLCCMTCFLKVFLTVGVRSGRSLAHRRDANAPRWHHCAMRAAR
jgi:hypothetical protein